MAKILSATAVGGIVTADGFPVAIAEILSAGVGASSGILIMDKGKAWYIPSAVMDLSTTLDKLMAVIDQTKIAMDEVVETNTQLIAALGTVSAATVPPTTGGITAPITAIGVNSTQITAAGVQLMAIKAQIQTLKEALK